MGLSGRVLAGLVAGLLLASSAFAQTNSEAESEGEQASAQGAGGAAGAQQPAQQEDSGAAASGSACGAGSIALSTGGCGKRWRLIGYAEYSQLVLRDHDPKNDQQIRGSLQGSYRVLGEENLQVWARVGFNRRFVAEQGESAAQFSDMILGSDYLHNVPLKGWEGRALSFQHRLFLSLPTSRDAQRQDMRLGVTGLERVRLNPTPYLFAGVDLVAGYRAFRYAERAGPQGTALPRANLTGRAVVEAFPFQGKSYGSLLVGADAGVTYTRTYEARGQQNTPTGDPALWRQRFNWDVYVYYMPLPFLWLGTNLGQNSPVLRGGAENPQLVHRDETQIAFSVIGIY